MSERKNKRLRIDVAARRFCKYLHGKGWPACVHGVSYETGKDARILVIASRATVPEVPKVFCGIPVKILNAGRPRPA